ncbi:antibiotic biosynthesis monooxygenase family protein [Microbulbifer variabilis]|uniref:antibiotic biosynthesis monooxygenase family protein n=1 Tax=Microbulbifer variabilis TaxID=266805 RepID=UPI001CFC87FE|nr:antibiotic biosynthesis monooxygenase [Microbulbifer variabilis]
MKYIFEVLIKEGFSAEEYADAWVRASQLIQRAPGAMGTELLQKIGDKNTLIAIATWHSKIERDAMHSRHSTEIDKIIRSVAPFVGIRLLGEFEEFRKVDSSYIDGNR